MKVQKFALSLAFALLTFSNCRTTTEDSDLQWGHLNDPDLTPTTPAYLINKTTDQKFKVCLAKYMNDAFPGIQTEIQAAVNIWAFYLGRSIPVAITVVDLPRAKADDTPKTLNEKYHSLCGIGFDTVIGLGPLGGTTVGQTSFSGLITTEEDGTKKLTSFKRYVFLRDFELTPPTKKGDNSGWETYQARIGKTFTTGQLLQLMKGRDQLSFSLKGKLLTLSTMTHEIGHVWGLCDQYENANNCDPVHSTSHMVINSMMGNTDAKEKIYLTNDDIEGIRALGARPGFEHDWKNENGGLTVAPTPIVLKPVENFQQLNYSQTDNNLVMTMSVVTNVPSKLLIELKAKDSTQWRSGSSKDSDASGFNWLRMEFTLELAPTDKRKYDARVTLMIKDTGGEFKSAGTITFVQP